jgi:hypothetical protein
MAEKPTYDICIGDSGFQITKRTADKVQGKTYYNNHFFTNWGDAARWLAMEMLPYAKGAADTMEPTEEERYRAAMKDVLRPPPGFSE